MNTRSRTSAGPNTGGRSKISSFSVTQAAWRFFNNEHVKLTDLIEPLQQLGRTASLKTAHSFVLVMHDWSQIANRNKDANTRTHLRDVGYDLTCSLLVDADHGSPLAPMAMSLQAKSIVHSTWESPPSHTPHIDQILPLMNSAEDWRVPKRLIHVIDREADSVGHFRAWDQAGHLFLVRADDRYVLWKNKEIKLSEAADALAFRNVGQARYRGMKARLQTAETTVVLHRPAKRLHATIPGRPLALRLIAARVVKGDQVLAQWLLLTNVNKNDAGADTVARWYYWRWSIESFFKLLKSAGHEVEQWKQETAGAIAKRLLVAAMACVVVWDLQRSGSPEAKKMKKMLMRLSGRAVKRSRPFTDPGLLAGLFVLLPILDLLESSGTDPTGIRRLSYTAIPFLRLREELR